MNICKNTDNSTRFQQIKNRVIHFNNGLYGWHVTGEDYRICLEEVVKQIKDKQKTSELVLATTTLVSRLTIFIPLSWEKQKCAAMTGTITHTRGLRYLPLR